MHACANIITDSISMHRAPEAGKKNRSSKPKTIEYEKNTNNRFSQGAVWVFSNVEMGIAEARYKSILLNDHDPDLPKSIFKSAMKSSDKIRFAIRHARFCFQGLGSSAHTNNTLALFDIIGETLQATISKRYATEELLKRCVVVCSEREGLFPEVQCTITVHQLYHIVQVSCCSPQHYMYFTCRIPIHYLYITCKSTVFT